MERIERFTLGSSLSIMLVNAQERDIRTLKEFLPIVPVEGEAQADLVIRYVDQLSPEEMNNLGINQFGYTDTDFYILNRYSGKAEAQISFGEIGTGFEIVCQRGVSKIPLLEELLKIIFLKKGVLSLHATAIQWQGEGTIMLGWARGGKTSALLALTNAGAKFAADDWVLYDLNSEQVFGFPAALSVSASHFQQIPDLSKKKSFSHRVYLRAVKASIFLVKFVGLVVRKQVLKKLLQKLEEKLRIDLLPAQIFDEDEIVASVLPDKFILLTNHNSDSIYIEDVSLDDLVEMAYYSNQFDRLRLYQAFLAYQYAFPNQSSSFFEDIEALEKQLLKEAFENKKLYRVVHPYPVPVKMFVETFREMDW